MTNEEKFEFEELKRLVEDLRFELSRKTGIGSADIKGDIEGSVTVGSGDINSASMFAAGVVDQAAIGANAVGDSEIKDELVSVTVSAGQPSGTATVTSGSVPMGAPIPISNQDQFVKSCLVSGTTLTITLLNNATADNVFNVRLIKT